MNRNIQAIPILFKGGLNLSSSVLELQAGEAIQLFNYEVNSLGRYQRLMGYERFDGRPAPSAVKAGDLPGWPFADDESTRVAVTSEREARRLAIQPIDGSGPIRGIAQFKGVTYAFRDSQDGDECFMWEASAQGWQKVATPRLKAGGKYEFSVANFGASDSSVKLYGVDSQNPLFEFDGNRFLQITGPIPEKFPTHIEILSSQIMVNAYEGGTFVYSAVGEPSDFLNGGEIGTGDDIVGLDLQANNAMAVLCRNRTYLLYGTSKADFQLQDLSKTTGAIEGTVQTMGDSVYLDDRGMTRLNRVQQFGNFDTATISQKVEPLLNEYIRRTTASMIIREKNQYRVCFDDGTGLICTFFGSEVSGFSTFDFQKVVRCAYSGEDETGREVVFFGSDDGYVYQMERGFSFDGEPIRHVLRPAFTDLGSPEYKKRWRKIVAEIGTSATASMFCTPEFDYADPWLPYHRPNDTIPAHIAQQINYAITAQGGGGFWDQAQFDITRWSSALVYTSDVYIDGLSRNISTVFTGDAIDEPPHVMNSVIIHFSPRGRRR
jgi:hypothetical protein